MARQDKSIDTKVGFGRKIFWVFSAVFLLSFSCLIFSSMPRIQWSSLPAVAPVPVAKNEPKPEPEPVRRKPTAQAGRPFNVADVVQLTVGSDVKMAPVRWRGEGGTSDKSYLLIDVEYKSISNRLHKFSPWSNQRGIDSPHPAVLRDNFGRKLKQASLGDKAIVGTALGLGAPRDQIPLHGGGTMRFSDLLVFELPEPDAEYFDLELPSQALGLLGWSTVEIIVRIPLDDVKP